MPIEKCPIQLSSETLPPAADRDRWRDPQPDMTGRESPKGRSPANPTPPGSGTAQKRTQKGCKSQRDGGQQKYEAL